MLLRTIALLMIMAVSASALHLNTFAVFELREQLQMLYINMWELLTQLQYVTDQQRVIVYAEIEQVRSEIQHTMAQLLEHDRRQHP